MCCRAFIVSNLFLFSLSNDQSCVEGNWGGLRNAPGGFSSTFLSPDSQFVSQGADVDRGLASLLLSGFGILEILDDLQDLLSARLRCHSLAGGLSPPRAGTARSTQAAVSASARSARPGTPHPAAAFRRGHHCRFIPMSPESSCPSPEAARRACDLWHGGIWGGKQKLSLVYDRASLRYCWIAARFRRGRTEIFSWGSYPCCPG